MYGEVLAMFIGYMRVSTVDFSARGQLRALRDPRTAGVDEA